MASFTTVLSTIGSALINFIGNIITALFGADGAWTDLLPFFLLGIIISVIMLGVKIMRKVTWGA